MKLCLAMMVQNEAHWLKLHLPVLLQATAIDGVVILDGGSEDNSPSEVARIINNAIPFHFAKLPFRWDFSAQGNALIELCEALRFDILLRLDPDELMFPDDINQVPHLLESVKVIRFPRYNFVGNRLRFSPARFPDYQTRAWRLGYGVRYSGMKVHETVEDSLRANGWFDYHDIEHADRKIYHYGLIAPHDERLWLKHENYRRLQVGEPILTSPPEGFVIPKPRINPDLTEPNVNYQEQINAAERFTGQQPIDPSVVGIYAPFSPTELGLTD